MVDRSMAFTRARPGVLCALVATLQIAGCGGGGGGSSGETAVVTPPPPVPITVTLTLQGKVIGVSLSSANVQTTLAGRTFTTTTDVDGNYQLPVSVPLDQMDTMVRLEARGVGEQSNQQLNSILGTFGRLQQQAGADGVLTRAENFATHVSFITTTEAMLLREDNGGAPITTDEQIRTLGMVMSATKAERLAIGMYMLLAHPERYASINTRESTLATIEYLETQNRLGQLVENYRLLDAGNPEALLNDPDVLITTDTLSGPVTLTGVRNITHPLAFHGIHNSAEQFNFSLDGSGSMHDAENSWGTTWFAENSAITITHPGRSRVRQHPCGDWMYLTLQLNTQDVVKKLSERFLIVERKYHVLDDYCGPQEDVTSRSAMTLLHETDLSSVDAATLSADSMTIYLYDIAREQIVVDVAHLQNDGRGRTEWLGAQFAWSQNAQGALVLEFDDGTTGTHRQLNTPNDLGAQVLYQLDYVSGSRLGTGSLIPVDALSRATLNTSQLLGRLREYGDVSERWPDMQYRDTLQLNADGTGTVQPHLYAQSAANPQIPASIPRPLSWTLQPASPAQPFAELVIQLTHDPVTGQYTCVPGQGDCVLVEERRLTSLRIDANRLYFLERSRAASSGVETDTPATSRVVFYDRHPAD